MPMELRRPSAIFPAQGALRAQRLRAGAHTPQRCPTTYCADRVVTFKVRRLPWAAVGGGACAPWWRLSKMRCGNFQENRSARRWTRVHSISRLLRTDAELVHPNRARPRRAGKDTGLPSGTDTAGGLASNLAGDKVQTHRGIPKTRSLYDNYGVITGLCADGWLES